MEIVKIKCPNCDAPIEISKEGTCKCPYCGASFMAEREDDNIIINTTINYYGGTAGTRGPGSYSTYSTQQKKPMSVGRVLAMVLGITLAIIMVVAVAIWGLIRMVIPTYTDGHPQITLGTGEDSDDTDMTEPKSEIMRDFVSDVYGKGIDEITQDDYNRMTEFHLTTTGFIDDWQFDYVLDDDGISHTWYGDSDQYDRMYSISLKDFRLFTKIKTLDLGYSNSIDMDSSNLNNLSELTTFISPSGFYSSQLRDFFADGTKIKTLGIDAMTSSGKDSTIDDIAKYCPNVEKLSFEQTAYHDESIKMSDITELNAVKDISVTASGDMSYLTGIEGLEGLTLNCEDGFSDFSFLYGMSGLKRLAIKNAENMKDLDFIDSMNDLTELDIEESIVLSFDNLASHTAITKLTLIDNSNIKDYSFLTNLTELESLTLYHNVWDNPVFPSLSGLTKLTYASIPCEWMDSLKGSQSLTVMDIQPSLATEIDFSKISFIPQLREITIAGGISATADIRGFRGLTEFTNLKTINLVNQNPDDDLAILLNNPTLETINIYGDRTGSYEIRPSLVEDNDHLKTLNLTGDEVHYAGANGWWDYSSSHSFGESVEIFSKLHAIEVLTVPAQKISDLSFVSGTPNLRKLDVSGNYIKDVSPLVDLTELRTLNIKDNPVANMDILPDTIDLIE